MSGRIVLAVPLAHSCTANSDSAAFRDEAFRDEMVQR